jgi:hypothetical protein
MALRCRPAGGGIKPPRGALANDCRAERRGKRRGKTASGMDREDERKDNESLLSLTCRNLMRRDRNRGRMAAPGRVWGIPVYCPDGLRHRGSMSPIQALVWNV